MFHTLFTQIYSQNYIKLKLFKYLNLSDIDMLLKFRFFGLYFHLMEFKSFFVFNEAWFYKSVKFG